MVLGTVKSKNNLINNWIHFVIQSFLIQILFVNVESFGQLITHLPSETFLYPLQHIEHSQSLSHFKQKAGHQELANTVQMIYHPEFELLYFYLKYLRKISFERKNQISLFNIQICRQKINISCLTTTQKNKLSVQNYLPSKQKEEQYVEFRQIEIPELIGVALHIKIYIYAVKGYKNQVELTVTDAPSLFLNTPKQGPNFLFQLFKYLGSQITLHQINYVQLYY
ncbi:unnamed protein product [Paramecium sonneborni]|uniref:Transmembrane protein n=1 Tax=Paramecium sonneborni TaxID=65129 RepID=A0A8S1N1G8_9CILI|nr:unnamed protein product [Paramecium sonneborni]